MATADTVDLTKLPYPLGQRVRRVDADGYPTQYTLDQEFVTRDAIEGAVGNMNTRLNEVTADFGTLSGKVTTLTQVVGDANSGLVRATSELTAEVTSARRGTASLTQSLDAIADDVEGLGVRYGVTGTINGATGGFVFTGVQRNDGGATFNMEFLSNVTIYGNLLVDGTIGSTKIALGAVSNVYYGVSNGQQINVSTSGFIRAGARVVILVFGAPNMPYTGLSGGTPPAVTCTISAAGVVQTAQFVDTVVRDIPFARAPVTTDGSGTYANVTYSSSYKITNFAFGVTWNAPSSGTFGFDAVLSGNHVANWLMLVIELAR